MVCGHFTSTCYHSFVIIHTKKNQHKKFVSCDFHIIILHAIVLCFIFLFFFIFWVLVAFNLKFGFISFFFHYIIHKHFTCIFTYHISIFRRLSHFQVSKKNVVLRWRKKNQTYAMVLIWV
jgi:hypothetical protein